MADIAMCSDKKCPSRTICYRFTAEPCPSYQSYAAFGRKHGQIRCGDFWSNEGTPDPSDDSITQKALRRKRISSQKYNEICEKIIDAGEPVHETLIKLLEEAGKYTIKGVNKPKSTKKCRKKGKSYPKGGKK